MKKNKHKIYLTVWKDGITFSPWNFVSIYFKLSNNFLSVHKDSNKYSWADFSSGKWQPSILDDPPYKSQNSLCVKY